MSNWDPSDEHWLSESANRDLDEEYVRVFELHDDQHSRVWSWFKNIGPRYEMWKLARSQDGDYSSFLDWHEQMVIVSAVVLSIMALTFGMGLSYVIDIDLVRRVVLIVVLASLFVSFPLRYVVLFALRHTVHHYTQDRIDDRWILDSHGRVEEVRAIDEFPFDE